MTGFEFEPYDWESDALVPELLKDWTEPELRLLHAKLRALGERGWRVWLKGHSVDAARHLSDAKPRRKRRAPAPDTHPHTGDSHPHTEATGRHSASAPPEIELLLLRYGALWLAQLGRHTNLHFDDPYLQRDFGTLRQRRAARGALLVELCGWRPEAWLWKRPEDLGDPFR